MEEKNISGTNCYIYGNPQPKAVVFWFTGEHERETIEDVYQCLQKRFAQAAFIMAVAEVGDWNTDLSPWYADAVFGKAAFAGRGDTTLEWLRDEYIPYLQKQYKWNYSDTILLIGGYSLSGLFALWAFYELGIFDGVAACSASVWFPNWRSYVKNRPVRKNSLIYLSLGIKEEKTRNQVMATVGDVMRTMHEQYRNDSRVKDTVLEWNQGNHFTQPDIRIIEGFSWLLKALFEDITY